MTDFEYYSESADILGMHQYPIARHQGYPYGFRTIYENVRKAAKILDGRLALSFGCQIFEYHAFQNDLPRAFPDEHLLRNMVWQALIGGANMLMGYSYSYMVPGYRNMGTSSVGTGLHGERFSNVVVPVFREVKEIEGWLLSTDDVPEVTWIDDVSENMISRWWRLGDTWMLLAANTSSEVIEARVDLSHTSGGIIEVGNQAYEWGNVWGVALQPYGTYRLTIIPTDGE